MKRARPIMVLVGTLALLAATLVSPTRAAASNCVLGFICGTIINEARSAHSVWVYNSGDCTTGRVKVEPGDEGPYKDDDAVKPWSPATVKIIGLGPFPRYVELRRAQCLKIRDGERAYVWTHPL